MTRPTTLLLHVAAPLFLALPACSQDRSPTAVATGPVRALSLSGGGEFAGQTPFGTLAFQATGTASRTASGTTGGRLVTRGTIPYPMPNGEPLGNFTAAGDVICLAGDRRADGLHVALLARLTSATPAAAAGGSDYAYLYIVDGPEGQIGWGGPAFPPLVPGVTGPCEVPASRPADAMPLVPITGRYTITLGG